MYFYLIRCPSSIYNASPTPKEIDTPVSPAPPDSRVVRAAIGIILRPPGFGAQAVAPASDQDERAVDPVGWRALVTRRPAGVAKAGAWEFPGGKIEPGEAPAASVTREVREEVRLDVCPVAALPVVTHTYPHATVELHPWVCAERAACSGVGRPWDVAGELDTEALPAPIAIEVAAARWVGLDELPVPGFLEANGPVIAAARAWVVGFEELVRRDGPRG